MSRSLASVARVSLSQLSRRTPLFRGKTRMLRAADSVLRRLGSQNVIVDVEGARFDLGGEDLIDFGLLYHGGIQIELVRYIASRLRGLGRAAVFWDVGANVGSFTLPIARSCPRVSVFAFEPSPSVNARLVRNLAINPELRHRVTVHALALSDRTGEADFFASREPGNSGVGGLAQAPNRAARAVKVRTVRGDELLGGGQVPPPDLMKVDVEGFEWSVFQGFAELLASSRPLEIIFEHSRYRFDGSGDRLQTCVELLQERGFSMSIYRPNRRGGIRPLRPEDLERSCDVIARRGV